MEKAAGRSARDLRRDDGGNARANVARSLSASAVPRCRISDLGAIVECLFAAHYSETEIVDYLTGPLGRTDAEAEAALVAARP